MVESHEATIQWSGTALMAQRILAAADRPHCEAFSQEEDGETLVSVVVQHTKLQGLRDIVDALLVDLADIEESA
jgi:hypothetical protein